MTQISDLGCWTFAHWLGWGAGPVSGGCSSKGMQDTTRTRSGGDLVMGGSCRVNMGGSCYCGGGGGGGPVGGAAGLW